MPLSISARSRTELLDVRQQPLADLLLIGFRQVRYFRNRQLEALHHAANLSPHRHSFQNGVRGSWSAALDLQDALYGPIRLPEAAFCAISMA
jgi:hypothetical protein